MALRYVDMRVEAPIIAGISQSFNTRKPAAGQYYVHDATRRIRADGVRRKSAKGSKYAEVRLYEAFVPRNRHSTFRDSARRIGCGWVANCVATLYARAQNQIPVCRVTRSI